MAHCIVDVAVFVAVIIAMAAGVTDAASGRAPTRFYTPTAAPSVTRVPTRGPNAPARTLVPAAPMYRSMTVIGDSISLGFNAQSRAECPNSGQPGWTWFTSDTHGSQYCTAGAEGVFSAREQLECASKRDVVAPANSTAVSGGTLLDTIVQQAQATKAWYMTSAAPAPRLTAVFIGHNDVCSNKVNKVLPSCSSADLDPNNYCRPTAGAFERELRKALDVLITVPQLRIAVAAPHRPSELCRFADQIAQCQIPTVSAKCSKFFQTSFLFGVSICTSITFNCSDSSRIIDAYQTSEVYRNVFVRVTAQYSAIRDNKPSPAVSVGGQRVGGAIKAVGTRVTYTESLWHGRTPLDGISCCDCFHPSGKGQNLLAQLAVDGLDCSVDDCCAETGDPLEDGLCAKSRKSKDQYPALI